MILHRLQLDLADLVRLVHRPLERPNPLEERHSGPRNLVNQVDHRCFLVGLERLLNHLLVRNCRLLRIQFDRRIDLPWRYHHRIDLDLDHDVEHVQRKGKRKRNDRRLKCSLYRLHDRSVRWW